MKNPQAVVPTFSIFDSDYAARNRVTDVFRKALEVVVDGLEKGPGCSDSDVDETNALVSLIRQLERLVTDDDLTWPVPRSWTREDGRIIEADLEMVNPELEARIRKLLFG